MIVSLHPTASIYLTRLRGVKKCVGFVNKRFWYTSTKNCVSNGFYIDQYRTDDDVQWICSNEDQLYKDYEAYIMTITTLRFKSNGTILRSLGTRGRGYFYPH